MHHCSHINPKVVSLKRKTSQSHESKKLFT
jgi:hypothetical protein